MYNIIKCIKNVGGTASANFLPSLCKGGWQTKSDGRIVFMNNFGLKLYYNPSGFCFAKSSSLCTREPKQPLCHFVTAISPAGSVGAFEYFVFKGCHRQPASPHQSLVSPQKHSRTAYLERFALLLVFSPQHCTFFRHWRRHSASPRDSFPQGGSLFMPYP